MGKYAQHRKNAVKIRGRKLDQTGVLTTTSDRFNQQILPKNVIGAGIDCCVMMVNIQLTRVALLLPTIYWVIHDSNLTFDEISTNARPFNKPRF
ncbi:hypothetical protein ACM43_14215 [Bradyrhizobium sp. CCBAU 45321]|nr:hypothetical protein [Bradyrhizobium sp. CCBAU 45321]